MSPKGVWKHKKYWSIEVETLIKFFGEPKISHKDSPLKIARQWSDEPNHFYEPKGFKIIGVEYGNLLVPTRTHQWAIKYQLEQVMKVLGLDSKLHLFRGP